MIKLVLLLAHPSPQPKRQINRLSHFCTAHGRKSVYFTMDAPFPKNCPFQWRDLDPHLTHGSLGPSEPITQTASRSVEPFFAQMTAELLYFTMGCPFSPQNCAFPWGDLDPHLIHGSLGPLESSTTQTPFQFVHCSAVFVGLTSVTD